MDAQLATEATAGRVFPIGSVIARCFRVFAKAPLFFLVVSLLCTAPVLVHHMTMRPAPRDNVWPLFIAILVQCGVLFATAAPVSITTFRILGGERPRVGLAIAKSLSRFLPVFLVSLIYNIVQVIGLVLLIVPGLIVAAAWVATAPVCTLEGLGPLASLKRSMVLTKGSRWRIFAVLSIAMLAGLVPVAASTGLALLLVKAHTVPVADALKWGDVLGDCIQVVVLAVALVANTVIYRALLPLAGSETRAALSNVFA